MKWSKRVKLVPAGSGESKREWPEKRFGTMIFTKNDAPDLVVEVT